MTALITIRDLVVERGNISALTVPELQIFEHEILAIVGPNGAGKSTLLLTLARLLKPRQGEMIFNGTNAENLSDTAYRRRIALVMQDPLLFDASVFDNVASGLRFRGVPNAKIQLRVHLWLKRMGVSHLAERRAPRLSGGEAQRVSLARALALEPELLLLDEPFSALDPPTRFQLLDDLATLLSEFATTTVFVTHDLAEATQLAHRLAVFVDNRLRQADETERVLNIPADEDVARFLEHRTSHLRGPVPS